MSANARPTQTAALLAYLEVHGSITPMDALEHLGCMRLAPRILELRAAGHRITTKLEGKGSARYARYSLTLVPA